MEVEDKMENTSTSDAVDEDFIDDDLPKVELDEEDEENVCSEVDEEFLEEEDDDKAPVLKTGCVHQFAYLAL